MFAYLYTGGNYSSGTGVNPPASSLPANAHIDYFRVYDAKPQAVNSSVSIAAGNASQAEGNSGSTPFTFTVTRSGDTTGTSSVAWAVTGSGGSPANAADFTGGVLPSGTLSFTAGQTSQTISVNVAGDTTVEADEGFTVTLSNPSAGTTIGTAAATGTILNDDALASQLSIAAGNASQAEGNSGSTPFTFTVTRSGDTTGTSSVAWAVTGSGGSPANAADFAGGVLPSGTLSFAAGQTSQTITVNVAGDTTVEPDEGFTVTLSNPSVGTTIGTAAATGTILNDDALASQLSIAAGNASQAEGNSGSTPFTFTVTRSGDTTGTSSVAWAVTGSGGSPANAADFAGGVLPSGTLSFAAGQTSQTITVNVAGDTTVEADDGFTVTLSNPSAGTTIGTAAATGTILNDDALASQLSIAAGNASQAEGNSGSTPFTFTVTRSGDTTGTSSVAWAVTGSGGSPANAADFTGGVLPSGTLSFAAGQTSQTITVNVAGDTTVEADEGFTVTLSNPSAGTTIGTAAATGTILNDDALASQLSIAAGNASRAEGNFGSTPFTFTVTRSGGTTGTSSVAWAVTGSGGSPANAADFTGGVLPSGTLSFAAGQTSQTITVNVAGDRIVEPNEGFTVTLSNASAGTSISTATATGTIRNDDFRFSGQQAGSLSPDVTASTIDGNGTPNDNIANATPASAATPNGMRFVGSAGPDTLSATGPGQILTGGAGVDTLVGYSGYGDIFSDTAAGLDGDTIINFGGSDVIDVTDLLPAATKPLAYVDHGGSGTLSVTDGTQSASINFAGSYSARNFTLLGTDGHGGTLIGYTAV